MSPLLDSVKEIRFTTVLLVSIIVLGTLIVVWLLIPDLSSGPTPVNIQRQPASVSPKPGDAADSADLGAAPEIVVEVAPGSGSEFEVVISPETPAATGESATGTTSTLQAQPMPAEPVQARPAKGRYILQAGAFARAGGAEGRLVEVRKLDLMARLEPGSIDGKELTRVLVGPFETRKQADEVQAKLTAARIDSFIRKVE